MNELGELVVEQIGPLGDDVLRTVKLHPLCRSIRIRLSNRDDRKEHFPERLSFPEWDPNRKVSDLSEPPPELR